MGGGNYSSDLRAARSVAKGYDTKSIHEIFSSYLHESMNPMGVRLRESRDSDEHPNSFPIIIALDVTGSMGRIPRQLIKDGLPTIMQSIIDAGFPDPQVLFIAIGDHISDRAPLQVGQFESSDEALDMWLERTWPEGNGGGNGGESYSLAWFFASQFTKHDSFEKRGKKGLLITIGDERCHSMISNSALNGMMGTNLEKSFNDTELLELARQTYDVFHINMDGGSSWNGDVGGYWKKLMPENVINETNQTNIAKVIADLVIRTVDIPMKTEVKPVDEDISPTTETML